MNTQLDEIQGRTFASATEATTSSYPPSRRLSDQQMSAYLQRRAYALVATGRPDGRPHVAMTAFALDGTNVWLPTVSDSVRERNIRRQPWASVIVTEGDHDEHVVVLLEGPTEVADVADIPNEIRAAFADDWVSVWLRLRAERVLSYAAEHANV
jgi:general stress protein 26